MVRVLVLVVVVGGFLLRLVPDLCFYSSAVAPWCFSLVLGWFTAVLGLDPLIDRAHCSLKPISVVVSFLVP